MKTPVEQARDLILDYDFSAVNFDKYYSHLSDAYKTHHDSLRSIIKTFNQSQIHDTFKSFYKTYYDSLRNVTRKFESVNNQVLHDSFKYFIGIEETDDVPLKLGYSKEGGYPHLPQDWELPDDLTDFYFVAQLNISDFKHLDIENIFPAKGIIYIFQHSDEYDCHVFINSEENDLVERDDIEIMLEEDSPMKFSAGWIFLINGENNIDEGITKLVPKDLEYAINEILNCKMQESIPSRGIQVKPNYWQGEIDDWDNEAKLSEEILLFETEIDGDNMHYWIDRSNLKSGNLQETYQTFSGS